MPFDRDKHDPVYFIRRDTVSFVAFRGENTGMGPVDAARARLILLGVLPYHRTSRDRHRVCGLKISDGGEPNPATIGERVAKMPRVGTDAAVYYSGMLRSLFKHKYTGVWRSVGPAQQILAEALEVAARLADDDSRTVILSAATPYLVEYRSTTNIMQQLPGLHIGMEKWALRAGTAVLFGPELRAEELWTAVVLLRYAVGWGGSSLRFLNTSDPLNDPQEPGRRLVARPSVNEGLFRRCLLFLLSSAVLRLRGDNYAPQWTERMATWSMRLETVSESAAFRLPDDVMYHVASFLVDEEDLSVLKLYSTAGLDSLRAAVRSMPTQQQQQQQRATTSTGQLLE